MGSKVKQYLRSVGAREDGALVRAIGDALRNVTPQDVLGYFDHCGFIVH